MKFPGLLFVLLLSKFIYAQDLKVEVNGGLANYQGDLQGKRFTLSNSKAAFGAGLSYSLNNHFSIRGIAGYMHIAADDKNNTKATGIAYRNLNFTSRVLEAQLALEYYLYNMQERNFHLIFLPELLRFILIPIALTHWETKYF